MARTTVVPPGRESIDPEKRPPLPVFVAKDASSASGLGPTFGLAAVFSSYNSVPGPLIVSTER